MDSAAEAAALAAAVRREDGRKVKDHMRSWWCELAGACHFLSAGMNLYRSRRVPCLGLNPISAKFDQARAFHPKQGTLRKNGAAE